MRRGTHTAGPPPTHLAVEAVHDKHVERKRVGCVEHVRLADVEPQVTLRGIGSQQQAGGEVRC